MSAVDQQVILTRLADKPGTISNLALRSGIEPDFVERALMPLRWSGKVGAKPTGSGGPYASQIYFITGPGRRSL